MRDNLVSPAFHGSLDLRCAPIPRRLDGYQPGVTWYLSSDERTRLTGIGLQLAAEAPAGTYARQVLGRLLIDLAWNSSRLEGSTYSLLETERLKELFIWARERSAARYRALRQTIGEPDLFRMRYRAALIVMVAGIVNAAVTRAGTPAALLELMPDDVRPEDRDALLDLALKELQIINEGNFVRYRVRPSSYRAWAEAWGRRSG